MEEEKEQEAERKHWFNVVRILQSYKAYVEKGLTRRHQHLNNLSEDYCNRLPSSSFQVIRDIDAAADVNQLLFSDIAIFQNHESSLFRSSDW